jgi:hypothetical protein
MCRPAIAGFGHAHRRKEFHAKPQRRKDAKSAKSVGAARRLDLCNRFAMLASLAGHTYFFAPFRLRAFA